MTIPMKLRGKAAAMIDREQLRAALARMETSLAETRRNLALAERALSDRAEAETIGREEQP